MRLRYVCLGAFVGLLIAGMTTAGAPPKDDNLAQNPGFETPVSATNSMPADWYAFSSGDTLIQASNRPVRSGQRSVQLTAQNVPNGYLGLLQNLPVTPDTEYSFSVYVLNNHTNRLDRGATGCIDIEWRNSGGGEIWRIESRWWSNNLSSVRWEEYKVSGRSPGNAETANFVVFLFDDTDGGKGSCFVDEARIEKK